MPKSGTLPATCPDSIDHNSGIVFYNNYVSIVLFLSSDIAACNSKLLSRCCTRRNLVTIFGVIRLELWETKNKTGLIILLHGDPQKVSHQVS